jgi:DNA polymerase IIIc chi subunit
MSRAWIFSLLVICGLFASPQEWGARAQSLVSKHSWAELTPAQRQILAPLAMEWDTFEKSRQEKWLSIANRYPAMTPVEQQRVQKRMREWVALSPEQRQAARERYKDLRNAPAEEKQGLREKWETYRNLPEEEKRKLAESNKLKPAPPRSTSATRLAPHRRGVGMENPPTVKPSPASAPAAGSAAHGTSPAQTPASPSNGHQP